MENTRPTLSAAEAAQYLGVSHDTIARLFAQGFLEGYKTVPKKQGRLRIYRDAVEEFDRQRKSRPPAEN